MISHRSLMPLFQILSNCTEQLEQGRPQESVVNYMGETLQTWRAPEEVRELSQPLRILTGIRTSSMPPPGDQPEEVVPGQGGLQAAGDEILPGHILRVLHLTAGRIRKAISGDDQDSQEYLDTLAVRWCIVTATMKQQFPGAKLFESVPPSGPERSASISQTLVTAAPIFSLIHSIIDDLNEQAGIFVFDPKQVDPALAVTLMMVNQATIRESGFAEGYLTGPTGFFQEMHPEDLPKLLNGLQQAIATGAGYIDNMRMKALRGGLNIWLSGDIKLLLPQGLMAGKRIGYFRFTDVRETGAVVEEI